MKQRKLVRGVILRDVEDPEIRIILSGKEFNARTLGEENAQADGVRSEVYFVTSKIKNWLTVL